MCERGEELTRDLFICDQDIRNVVGRLAIETYKRDNNDVKFVRTWVQEHPHLVFYYKKSSVHVCGAITPDNMPFMIATNMVLKHGHKKNVSIDVTFATNENKVCCYHASWTIKLQTVRAKYFAKIHLKKCYL